MNYLGGRGNDELNGDGAGIKRPRREETHVCEKCCAEFFSFSEFLDHKKNCTKTPPVLILKDSEGPMSSEDFFLNSWLAKVHPLLMSYKRADENHIACI